jgi:N-hydroxyarylamine O-acetyltransferase
MAATFQLPDYLARIGVSGPVRPDLSTLRAIHAAHVRAIPFESLDPFLGRGVSLDLDVVQAKLVDSRRGGYCFEQNVLLKGALESIGFAVTGLGGRVRWMSPLDAPLGPREHMILQVDLPEGPWLADAGFGACLLDAPLPLRSGDEHPTTMGRFRLTEDGGLWSLQAMQPGGWRTAYVFDLVPQLQADHELGNWYTSTSPIPPFQHVLIVERLAAGRRHKLVNHRYVVEGREGDVLEERELDAAAFGQVLDEVFGITPPVAVNEVFDRFNRAAIRGAVTAISH